MNLKKALIRLVIPFTKGENIQQRLGELVRILNYLRGFGGGAEVESSGELAVLALLPESPVIFDVGANIGEYTNQILKYKPHATIHAFEPGIETFTSLKKNVQDWKVNLNNSGLGAKNENRPLYTDKLGSGHASLTKRFMVPMKLSETVKIERLDDYCSKHTIPHIDLLKVDVEGHEIDVLEGGKGMISDKKVSYVIFEFGGTSVDTHHYFRDYYTFFTEVGMKSIYRVLPSGSLLPIRKYTEDLEIFKNCNYVVEFGDK